MNIASLFDKTRKLIDDVRHNSNDDSNDQFFTDSDLLGIFNMSINDFNHKTNYKESGFEDINTKFNTVIDQDIYDLNDSILRVHSVSINNKIIQEESFDSAYKDFSYNFSSSSRSNTPYLYQLDYINKKIRIYPIPSEIKEVSLRTTMDIPQYTLSQLNSEIPLPSKYHEYFKFFIASQCLMYVDNDTENLSKSNLYRTEWETFCTSVSQEIRRRSSTIINIHNGDYNDW